MSAPGYDQQNLVSAAPRATVQSPSPVPENSLPPQRTAGNRATNQALEFSEADGDLVLAVAATLDNVQRGVLEYPKSYGANFPQSKLDLLQDIIYAATDTGSSDGRARSRRLANVRKALQPILQRLVRADPLAGPQYVSESIEGPLGKLEGRVQGVGIAHRAEIEAGRDEASEWLAPWEVDQLREVCAQAKICVDEVTEIVRREAEKKGAQPDPNNLSDRQANKVAQAEVTAINRTYSPILGAGNTNLAKGPPNATVVGLAALSHAKAVLDIVDQALLLSDGPQRRKLFQDILAPFDDSKSSAEKISGALLGVQTGLLVVEAAITTSSAVLAAVGAGKAIAGKISFADFAKAASTNFVRTGFLVSGARITGMLNVITTVRGAIRAADPAITVQDRAIAVRDALSGAVGAIRYLQVPFEAHLAATAPTVYEGAALTRYLAWLGKLRTYRAATAGAATWAIWLAWLEFEGARTVLENAPKAVGRLIDYDLAQAFQVLREEGAGLETQLRVALNLGEAISKLPNDDTPQAQGLQEVYTEALAELRKRAAHAYNASGFDGGTNTPGHYAHVRNALRGVDAEVVRRGLTNDALPEETIMAAIAVLGGIRQAWSSYDVERRDSRTNTYADRPAS